MEGGEEGGKGRKGDCRGDPCLDVPWCFVRDKLPLLRRSFFASPSLLAPPTNRAA